MHPTHRKIFDSCYLKQLEDYSELERAIRAGVAAASSLEKLLQIRVEMIVIVMRFKDLPIPPDQYVFLQELISEVQLKIACSRRGQKESL